MRKSEQVIELSTTPMEVRKLFDLLRNSDKFKRNFSGSIGESEIVGGYKPFDIGPENSMPAVMKVHIKHDIEKSMLLLTQKPNLYFYASFLFPLVFIAYLFVKRNDPYMTSTFLIIGSILFLIAHPLTLILGFRGARRRYLRLVFRTHKLAVESVGASENPPAP